MTELNAALEKISEVLAQQAKQVPVTPDEAVAHSQVSTDIQLITPTLSTTLQSELQRKPPELIGHNAVCYQGVQRTFRNAVVVFLRERLTRLFPDDHPERLKKTFGDEWKKLLRTRSSPEKVLGTTTSVRDEYDLLGTNHFYNVFERIITTKIFSPEDGQPQDLPKPVKPRFLGNLKAIKDR